MKLERERVLAIERLILKKREYEEQQKNFTRLRLDFGAEADRMQKLIDQTQAEIDSLVMGEPLPPTRETHYEIDDVPQFYDEDYQEPPMFERH